MAGVYTVTQINSYIKNMFRQDFVLNRIQISIIHPVIFILL